MAVTVNSNAIVFDNTYGRATQRLSLTSVTGDTSYATGGSALSAAQLGLTNVAGAVCVVSGSASNNGGTTATYNVATNKLQVWNVAVAGALTEAASAANLSGLTITVLAIGN